MSIYALMGITGHVGSVAGQALLDAGERVRAVVRDKAKSARWSAKGADVAFATIDDASALQKAFSGVDGVFVMTPTWIEAEDIFVETRRAIKALGNALRGAKVPKVVLLSSIGAQHSHGTGAILKLHALEEAFADLPAVTSIRAAYFMENYAGMTSYARDSGVLPSLLDPLDRAIPMVAVEDVGRLVADTLRESWSGQRVIELEGPQRHTPDEVATALTAVLGRSVKAEILPRGHWDQAFRSWGFTVGSSKTTAELLDGFNSGWIEFEKPEATVHGTTPLRAVLANLVEQLRS
jgi:uncharacterized protein YbjT (DUF2867 family)